ncbi:hypothetical protein FACS1894130_05880 [Spirochaetia bacterium]|nr:hypothetical protein FACS1894130_05880 [Spirochaetia bacterium]
MEKPGMDRRCRCLRAGLLTLLLCAALPPQEGRPAGDDNMMLSVQTFPEIPEAGMPWTITILADHPVPGEVQVLPPEFPGAITLEQVRSLPWVTETGERWTSIEYRFIPQWGGTLFIGSFEVLAPEKRAFTRALVLEVHGAADVPVLPPPSPRLTWAGPPAQLRTGEPVEFRLLVIAPSHSQPSLPVPTFPPLDSTTAAASYHPLLPENAIIEVFPPESPGTRGVPGSDPQVLLRLRVIPLGGSRLIIKPAELILGDQSLPVPGLEIPILPAPAFVPARDAAPASSGITAPETLTSDPVSAPLSPFPYSNSAAVFYPFRPGYENALNTARTLWSSGQAAGALALLRQSERDLLSGPALAATRRSAEALLQLGPTRDEPWRPRVLYLAGSFLTTLALVILLLRTKFHGIFRRRSLTQIPSPGPRKSTFPVTFRGFWGSGIVIVMLILLTSLGFYGFIEGTPRVGPNQPPTPRYRPVKGRAVVLRAGDAYRVPHAGGVSDFLSSDILSAEVRFREGEAARIREAAEDWVYVETLEGKAGWMSVDRVILY